MKNSIKLLFAAVLSLSVGIAFAAPLYVADLNVKPFPRVPEGPKADFSVNVVYANFNPVNAPAISASNTYPAVDVAYTVVLNVTNLSDQPATIYEIAFTAAQGISVKQSILGGAIYETGTYFENGVFPSKHFGGIVDGVYLDGTWVNVTWIPVGQYEADGTWVPTPYPECLFALTQTHWQGGIMSGPLNPEEVRAFSADHTINSTITDLPTNASDTGVWFEGIPIAEYYDLTGNPLVTEMYINGSWVDVTGRVTVEKTQPFMVASNMLVNNVLSVGAQPYENWGNATAGPITALPSWGDWGVGRCYSWLPWDWGSTNGFNNTWAPHESRLIMFNNTQTFIDISGTTKSGLAALQSGNIKLYASASNYINNWPVNGTYYNTVSTATQLTDLQLETTPNGYLYNAILADNETFHPTQTGIEVIIGPRT